MANVDAAFGLKPVRYLSGAPYNGAANRYYIPAGDTNAAAYVGSLVKLAGSADSDGIPTVTANVATSNSVVGVVVAVEPETADSPTYRVNSTGRYVYVADDPNLVFEVQEDSDSESIVADEVGTTADLTGFTSGSSVTGLSAIEIDSDTAGGTTGDHDVQILRLAQRPDNSIGTNAVWEVRLLNHDRYGDAVGV